MHCEKTSVLLPVELGELNSSEQPSGSSHASGHRRLRATLTALTMSALLAACGGSGGGDASAGAKGVEDGFTLGGTISGLSSSGLVLRSGADLLTPAADTTTFQFATPIAESAAYSISIETQPLGFVRCSLPSDASGVMAAANISTVAIGCSQATAAVSTIAGNGAVGSADGSGSSASFKFPYGVARDSAGSLYVADGFNHRIRKIASDGTVTTLAGSGIEGASDGPGSSASFSYPFGVAVDSAGVVYVADWGNHSIRKVAADGQVTTLAGNGTAGSANGSGAAASFNGPFGVAVDAAGAVYVADTNNNLIRKVSAAGLVTTLAGSGAQGADNGSGTSASFRTPQHLTLGADGTVYVADTGNHQIRAVTAAGAVTNVAGTGQAGSANGAATAASFNGPAGVAVDAGGTLFVADSDNHLVRRITRAGLVSTLAGSGSTALADGNNGAASFNTPRAIAVDSNGNLVVADGRNHAVRRVLAQ